MITRNCYVNYLIFPKGKNRSMELASRDLESLIFKIHLERSITFCYFRREKMITESNVRMAERLLAKESFVGQKNMRRSIDEYEQLKKTMSNNRRVLHPTSVFKSSLPAIDRKR